MTEPVCPNPECAQPIKGFPRCCPHCGENLNTVNEQRFDAAIRRFMKESPRSVYIFVIYIMIPLLLLTTIILFPLLGILAVIMASILFYKYNR